MKSGDAFLVDLQQNASDLQQNASVDSHCWMIISDTDQDPNFCLIVNFTSWRQDKDQACVVERSEHPYVSKKTCINYAEAKHVSTHRLRSLLEGGKIKLVQPLSPELLLRIRSGAADSKSMELGNYQFLDEQGLV